MVSTKKVCRSGQSMSFAHYSWKPFQHSLIDKHAENKNLVIQSKALQKKATILILRF